uniref:C2H2-type domain-containing protein n=1 Tax=Mastacembelus armatus TaxID=205130 RepID=A0A3Q3LKK9_9TELE
MTVVSPQKRESPSHKLESPKQASSASETTNAPTETCLGLKTLVQEPPVSVLPVVQLAVNQKCSAVVKLTRLPFPMSTNESVLVSKFLSNGSLLSTDTCLSANTSMSEEPNVIQEKTSASSDTCISLKELPNSSYMQPSISSKQSATVFEKSAVAISTTKPSADEHALDLDWQVISSSNEPTAEEKQDGASPRKTKSTSMSPNRSRSSREAASSKRTKSTSYSPRGKNAASPKVSTNKSVPGSHRRSTLTKVSPSIKQNEKDSNSFNSRRHSIVVHSVSTKISKSEAGFPSARWPKLPTDSVSSKRAGESTPAKKPRLVQASTSPKKNVRVVEAKKLPKVVKVETVTKIRESVNQANGEAMKNIRTQAVWTPPRMPASKTSSAGGKSSSPLEAKKETRLPRSVVYPPSVFLHPIPVKAAPIVSPLQPLLVIGKHLLKNQCGACGRVLSSIAALESHVSLHTGNRPFSCSLCGKTFPDSKSFKRHDRVHRNGRIHVCKHCGKGFVYRFGLSKHLRMVHSRIRPFVCQICNKGFFTKRDVEAHIRIHTGEKPFHCNLCEKKFASRVKLNVHFRWHNGEKRHWCPYCGKGFLDFNNLKRHKYIHTGEKPYSCPYCSKHFSQSGHVKKHVMNVHKIESD